MDCQVFQLYYLFTCHLWGNTPLSQCHPGERPPTTRNQPPPSPAKHFRIPSTNYRYVQIFFKNVPFFFNKIRICRSDLGYNSCILPVVQSGTYLLLTKKTQKCPTKLEAASHMRWMATPPSGIKREIYHHTNDNIADNMVRTVVCYITCVQCPCHHRHCTHLCIHLLSCIYCNVVPVLYSYIPPFTMQRNRRRVHILKRPFKFHILLGIVSCFVFIKDK